MGSTAPSSCSELPFQIEWDHHADPLLINEDTAHNPDDSNDCLLLKTDITMPQPALNCAGTVYCVRREYPVGGLMVKTLPAA
jgi:hypothetical protein